MTRRPTSGADRPPRITHAAIVHMPTVADADAAVGAHPGRNVEIEIENPSEQTQHVWASRRGYAWDAAKHHLTLYLTDEKPDPTPGIIWISDHPRTPLQVPVEPGAKVRIKVPVPHVFRRRTASKGLGMSFVEEAIDPIDRIELHIQHATEPLRHLSTAPPAEHRQHMRTHGQVVHTTITLSPSPSKE